MKIQSMTKRYTSAHNKEKCYRKWSVAAFHRLRLHEYHKWVNIAALWLTETSVQLQHSTTTFSYAANSVYI